MPPARGWLANGRNRRNPADANPSGNGPVGWIADLRWFVHQRHGSAVGLNRSRGNLWQGKGLGE